MPIITKKRLFLHNMLYSSIYVCKNTMYLITHCFLPGILKTDLNARIIRQQFNTHTILH